MVPPEQGSPIQHLFWCTHSLQRASSQSADQGLKCNPNIVLMWPPEHLQPHSNIRKMYFWLWEYLEVVRLQSQGAQIPEYTGLIKWPSGAPRCTSEWSGWTLEGWWQQREHWQAQTTFLGAPRCADHMPGSIDNRFGSANNRPESTNDNPLSTGKRQWHDWEHLESL